MTPLAYNYFGELVYQKDQQRFVGKNIHQVQPEQQLPPFRALRIDPALPESSWLCALAFSAQPRSRVLSLGDFFKLCTSHLPVPARQSLLHFFCVDALHAFYRQRMDQLDSVNATAESLALLESDFKQWGLPSVFLKWPELSSIATPSSLQAIRSFARQGLIDTPLIEYPFFNPFDQLPQTCYCNHSVSSTPWSLSFNQPFLSFQSANGLVSRWPSSSWKIDSVEEQYSYQSVAGSIDLHFSDILPRIHQAHQQALGYSGRQPYDPLSPNNASSSFITNPLHQAHRQLKQDLIQQYPSWDQFVASHLALNIPEMRHRLSAEQIDACGIAFHNFKSRKSFILADETGLGKGRVLAALAKSFLSQGRPVLFITEKKHLFSDFWRDLTAVFDHPPVLPFLMHPKGRLMDQQGQLLAKALPLAKYKTHLETYQATSPLILTTYSQFNRNEKHSVKLHFVLEHLKNGLLILDESHSASGESHTRSNVLKMIEQCSQCIFSSATYAKNEQSFELYQSATPLLPKQMSVLLSSFSGIDPLVSSNALAQGLVRIGSMVRREHAPELINNTHILEPSLSDQSTILNNRLAFSKALESLFQLQSVLDQVKLKHYEEVDTAWIVLGGILSRLSRQFNLLSKIETSFPHITHLLSQNKKPILALESTFEAFLRLQLQNKTSYQLLSDDIEIEEDDVPHCSTLSSQQLSFQALFSLLVEQLVPEESILHYRDPQLTAAKALTLSHAQQLPSWFASPIDTLKHRLQTLGFSVGEISGRSFEIVPTSDSSQFSIQSRDKDQRESTVRSFNDGQLDVLILTVAGASGISLHAAPEFKDHRVRAFIELEVCTNPSQRMQFLGRVRRKGQLVSPEYYALSSGTPYEHRLLERAVSKQQKLSGLTSATQHLAAGSILLNQLMTPEGNRIALEWLQGHFSFARQLGLHPHYLILDESCTIIEKLLKRLPLLPTSVQDEVFTFLNQALSHDQVLSFVPHEYLKTPVLARSRPIWGTTTSLSKDTLPHAFNPSVHLQEWTFVPPVAHIGLDVMEQRLSQARQDLSMQQSIQSLQQACQRFLNNPQAPQAQRFYAQHLQNIAIHLKPGAMIKISHPYTGRVLDGLLMQVKPPSQSQWLLFPSQWQLQIVFPGMPFELSMSLASFFTDPLGYIDVNAPPFPAKAWNQYIERPSHFSTLKGHCGYTRWYAHQYQASFTFRFQDATIERREEIGFPFSVSLEELQTWKIPLIDHRLTLQLMQKETQLILDDSAKPGQPFKAVLSPTAGGWMLSLEQQYHQKIVDFALERRLGPRQYVQHHQQSFISRFISSKDIHSVVSMLHQRSCRFFAPANRSQWHAHALDYILHYSQTLKPSKKTGKRSS